MLHLTGYDLSLDDLRQFRQWGSRTPGHPEFHHTAGIEVTTGPLGQGVANAVGMAIAERWLADHVRPRGRATTGPTSSPATAASWRGSRTRRPRWPATSASGGCSASTTTTTSRSTARPSSPTTTTCRERFEAYGWRVRNLGEMANDVDGLEAAIREALEAPADEPDAKPTLLVLRSHIGWPSPKLTDTAEAHGNPFGADEIRVTKEILGLPARRDLLGARRGAPVLRPAGARAGPSSTRPGWSRFAAWKGDRAAWDAAQAGHGLPGWADDLPVLRGRHRAGHPARRERRASTPRPAACPASSPGRPT